MSGGVDSAAAAQLALDAGDDVVAVTLELWSDPATDGEQSCCSPQAVQGARRLAHGMGLPHVTLDVRERFRAEVVDELHRRVRGRAYAQPVRPLQRRGALRRDARRWRTRSAPPASRPATTRASPATSEGPLVRAAADPKQGPELHAREARPGRCSTGSPSRSAGSRRTRCARSRATPACPSPTSARARTCASSPASAGAPSSSATAGRAFAAPGEIVDRDGDGARPSRRPAQLHRRPAPRPRRRRATSRSTCSSGTPREPRGRRPQGGARHHPRGTRRRSPPPRPGRGRDGAAALPLPRAALPSSRRPADGRLTIELAEPAHAIAPGQLACLMREEAVVGYGTIGEPH